MQFYKANQLHIKAFVTLSKVENSEDSEDEDEKYISVKNSEVVTDKKANLIGVLVDKVPDSLKPSTIFLWLLKNQGLNPNPENMTVNYYPIENCKFYLEKRQFSRSDDGIMTLEDIREHYFKDFEISGITPDIEICYSNYAVIRCPKSKKTEVYALLRNVYKLCG